NAAAAAENRFRSFSAPCTRRPGKAQPRSKIKFTANVCLIFVAQTKAEQERGAYFPIIGCETRNFRLRHSLKRNTGRDRKLGRIITRTNHTCYLAAILLDRRYHRIGIQIACVGTEKSREKECSAIIILRLIGNSDMPQLAADLHG